MTTLQGRWVRTGRRILVLPDQADRFEAEAFEVGEAEVPSARDLIDPRIDPDAQVALRRLFVSAPEDAAGMFGAVERGALAGIYRENEAVPALRVRKFGLWWWQVIPPAEDAVLVLDPASPLAGPPLIAFRDRVKRSPERLDPALLRAWRSFRLLRSGVLVRCDVGIPQTQAELAGAPVANVVPPILCQASPIPPIVPAQFPPRKAPPKPKPAPKPTPKRFAKATTIRAYIDLVREAERRLIAAGHTSVDARIQILSGVYYGTDWSRDFDAERSQVRNKAFQVYTARSGPGADPRPILGASLFPALKASGDVPVDPRIGTVDLGHVMIGLNARASVLPRTVVVPTQGGTGLEIVTWVGDLGGATGRVARDRVRAPKTPASKYFTGRRGRDYGADSNLEGDVAGYVVGSGSGATSLRALTVPSGTTIADALAAYFLSPTALSTRAEQFLQMVGGTLSGGRLTNRVAVEAAMASKFNDFGLWYVGTRYGVAAVFSTSAHFTRASVDVAKLFVDWLLARLPGAAAPSSGGAGSGTRRSRSGRGTRATN